MSKYIDAYDQKGAVTPLYASRRKEMEEVLRPLFTSLLDDGFSYNDIRGMLIDSSIEFVQQQVAKEFQSRQNN